ncbi:MAG: hypothetical protein JO060_03155 [Candidatus Eremiobacteraeota bacterium]|nr:hypothetical protein [Candidatus Eremiobacteraeota bacterium]
MQRAVFATAATALAAFAGISGAFAQPTPSATPSAAPTAPPLPPAGVIPASISLTVTGTPADSTFLASQIQNALDRRIRPTLQPGAAIHYGAIVPWPIAPLAAGFRSAVNVAVSIDSSGDSAAVNGTTTVNLTNATRSADPPSLLFLSDDPEYIPTEGLAFRGIVDSSRSARLYYYHDDIGLPRDLDVVLTTTQPTRLRIADTASGPDLDVMSVGHVVSRDFLQFLMQNESVIVDVAPEQPFIVQHHLLLQGELVAGVMDLEVLSGGPVTVSVIASQAGGHPERYLNGPRLPVDGHNRHGTFQLSGYGDLTASYTLGGPDAYVKYGNASTSPRNVDPSDPGHDWGDYGVVHRITFNLTNPGDTPLPVYLYERPLGGAVRSTFVIDGELKEVGCARLSQPYWLKTYEMAPHARGLSTTLTMTDGGSFYPIQFGVTSTQPVWNTPPLNAPDGCSPSS